jgi:hypothetical protein
MVAISSAIVPQGRRPILENLARVDAHAATGHLLEMVIVTGKQERWVDR